MKNNTIGIGLLGLGTVGTGVYRILKSQQKKLEERTGIRLVVRRVCVRSLSKRRGVKVPRKLLTRNPKALIQDPAIDIVVELIGGIQPAKRIIVSALKAGKHVVTANKALLAESGENCYAEAARRRLALRYEASVCGGIPIVKAVREGLASNNISSFLGIMNGTCNYILTQMSKAPVGFAEALRAAQQKGYAESNPKLDIEGIDSAHKLAILAKLAFGGQIPFKAIPVEGIKGIAKEDIDFVKELGYCVKLLAIGKRRKAGLELRVHPTLLSEEHPLASVRGVYNAVFVHSDQADDLLFYGKGAGMFPTASAVLSDIIDIAREIIRKGRRPKRVAVNKRKNRVLPIDHVVTKYYLRFQVHDKPGVLGFIAKALGENRISILSVHQKESHDPKSVPVIFLTYAASEKDLRKALRVIHAHKQVSKKTIMIRIEK